MCPETEAELGYLRPGGGHQLYVLGTRQMKYVYSEVEGHSRGLCVLFYACFAFKRALLRQLFEHGGTMGSKLTPAPQLESTDNDKVAACTIKTEIFLSKSRRIKG